ncbi:hypothetical protein MAPG_01321 [Magnaporthiopsis poae ATCC 64411]|uniref:Nucleoside-diphosphate-sugar epimerase n=1 Tax=Magnaporthiopsis poae (strain ATCC 64411 / 73-15) TaxID=644358 RepID=A0A0C4DNE0_MAGP6|nr:hypothetical protein MAPG_01321 [Magnaporthiopsis poae ATCC 64411]
MHAILTGATGLVGSGVLDAMLKAADVTKITILSRRPVKMAEDAKDPRVNTIIHPDFERYGPDLISQLRGASGVVWALGISQSAVGSDEYIKITKTYALEAAKAFSDMARSTGEPFNFVYVSGEGATLEPGRFSPIFARVKGETEAELARMREENPLFRANTVRPGAIDYTGHDAIKPYMPVQPLLNRAVLPAFRALLSSQTTPTESLGRFLTDMAIGKWSDASKLAGSGVKPVGSSGFAIVHNSAVRRMMGLDKP